MDIDDALSENKNLHLVTLMYQTNFSELIDKDVRLKSSNVFPYHQRKKFGNSKVILPKDRNSIPLSATILSRDFILKSFPNTNLLVNLELHSHQPQNLIEGSPRVIVQSNIRSAFDL